MVEFNSKRTLFFFFAMVYTIVKTAIRFFLHCTRDRYPRLYRWHILIFYILGQFRFSIVAYYKYTQVEESAKKEMAGVLFKSAQDQMSLNMFAQVIFMAPSYSDSIIAVAAFMMTESALV